MNKNKLLVRLLSDKERYADLINGYSGAQVVRAEDLSEMDSIFDFIRCSKDGKKLKQLVNSDSAYQNLDEAAYDVIAAFTHTKELTHVNPCYKKGGKVDMCEGIRQLMEESKSEGFSIGRNEGISIGKNQGISIGRNEGRHEGISTAFDIIRQLKQGISPEELIAQGNDEGVVQQALALL